MPQAIPFIVAAAQATAAAFATISITTMLVTMGVSMVVSFAAQLLFKPDTPSFNPKRTLTIRSATAARPIVYGESRSGGVLVYAGVHNSNKFLDLIIVWSQGEVESIDEIWFGDEQVQFNPGTGLGTGKFEDKLQVNIVLGTPDQAAMPDAVTNIRTWSSAHRLRGLACVYLSLKFNLNLYPQFSSQNVSFVGKGRKIYDPREGGHVATDPTTWEFSNSGPLVENDYIRGVPFIDGNGDFVRLMGLAVEDENINTARLIASANAADTSVGLAEGGFVNRYPVNGVVSSAQKPSEVIGALTTAMAGATVYVQGQWEIIAGEAQTPVLDFGDDDIIETVIYQPRRPRRTTFNSVRAVFINPSQDWQPYDAPERTSATFVAQDNGEKLYADLSLPFTTKTQVVQRLMKIALLQNRQQITFQAVLTLKALAIKPYDWVTWTSARRGWTNKIFRVVSWEFIQTDRDGAPYLAIMVKFEETDASVFDWNAEEEGEDPAPDTELPDFSQVGTPTDLAALSGNAQLLIPGDGTIISRILVSWTTPDDGFVLQYELEWKLRSEADFSGVTLPQESTSHFISGVQDGELYDIRIRAMNFIQSFSDFVVIEHTVIGKSAPPADVTGFSVLRQPDGTREFTWDPNSLIIDPDLAGYEIRFVSGTSFTWETATKLNTGPITTSPLESNQLAAGQFTIAIKALDTTGNESTNENVVIVTIGDPRLRAVLLSQSEFALDWPGALTSPTGLTGGFINAEGIIEALADLASSPPSDWDSLPATWSVLNDTWSDIVAGVSTVIYITDEFDLGADIAFNPLISVQHNGSVTIEMKTGTDADGGVVGSFVTAEAVSSKRFAQFRITVTKTTDNILISDITVTLDGETIEDFFEDIDLTASPLPEFVEKVSTGRFIVSTPKAMASITQAEVVAIQGVSNAGFTSILVTKSATWTKTSPAPGPAAEFLIVDGSATPSDAALLDVRIRGPKEQ